jgi:hypothetical protein
VGNGEDAWEAVAAGNGICREGMTVRNVISYKSGNYGPIRKDLLTRPDRGRLPFS